MFRTYSEKVFPSLITVPLFNFFCKIYISVELHIFAVCTTALICLLLHFYFSSFDVCLWCGNLCLSWSSNGLLLFPIKPETLCRGNICVLDSKSSALLVWLFCLPGVFSGEAQSCVTVVVYWYVSSETCTGISRSQNFMNLTPITQCGQFKIKSHIKVCID